MSVVGLVLLGLVAGIFAAGLGVGGGLLFVPALVVLFGFDQQLAQGTSLAVILPTAVVATIVHHRRGPSCGRSQRGSPQAEWAAH